MARTAYFFKRYYGFLQGATIKDAGVRNGWPFFTIVKDGVEYTVEVSRDPEGNGPGFLFGLPDPDSQRKS